MANPARPIEIPSSPAGRPSRRAPRSLAPSSSSWAGLAEGVVELLRDPVFVADRDGVVRARNQAAESLLIQATGLSVEPHTGELRHDSPSGSRELARRINVAAAGVRDELPFSLTTGVRPPLLVRVLPLRTSADLLAAVFVTPMACAEPPRESEIQERLNATPMEAKVAQRLAAGKTLVEIGLELGVAVQTVRGHLKQIYVKTGTHRQAELVSLVLALRMAHLPA